MSPRAGLPSESEENSTKAGEVDTNEWPSSVPPRPMKEL